MSGEKLRGGLQFFLRRYHMQRPAKFAFVGAIGVVVQLAALEALLALGCDYVWAAGLAVEMAVLHNFMWHRRFTWKDRGVSDLRGTRVGLLRFHLGNGAISILGSLLLLRCFVGEFGMNVLVANLLTIAACSVANFFVSDRWVFLLPVTGGRPVAVEQRGLPPGQTSVEDGRGRPSLHRSGAIATGFSYEEEAGCGRSPIRSSVRCAKGT
jgi:putative flippase GtrA